MAAYNSNILIDSSGTEVDLYKKIIQYITGLDTRITCENDPDVEFNIDAKGSTYVPQFNFKLGTVDFFKLYRPSNLGSNAQAIGVKIDLTQSINVYSESIHFKGSSGIAYNTNEYRAIYMSSIITQGLVCLWFRSKIGTSNYGMHCIIAVSGQSYYKAGKTESGSGIAFLSGFNDLTFYDTNLSNNLAGKFISRFDYGTLPGTIDYVKSAVFYDTGVGGSGDNRIKAFEIPGIYDCTTVTARDIVSLKDGVYLAMAAHELVKIS